MARIFKRGKVYYTWVPKPEGGTKKVTTNCTDPTAARARAAELERIAVDPERAAAAKAALRDALELLIRDRLSAAKAKKRTKSMATVDFYRKKSGVLLDGLAAVLRRSPKAVIYLREITAAVVDDYIIQRREDGVEDSTIGKELTTLRASLRLAKRRGLWPGDIDQVFPKGFGGGGKPGERYVTPAELVALFRAMVRPVAYRKHSLTDEQLVELRARLAAGEKQQTLAKAFRTSTATIRRLRSPREEAEAPIRGHEYFAIVAFAIATGAEPSAIWRARRGDAAPDRSWCLVRGSKNVHREDRPVPLPLLAFRMLLDYAVTHADGDRFLFPATHQSAFRRTLAEACDRAGIRRVSLTDLRRTHGKWLRLSGASPDAIGASLGHADGRMAERVYGKASALELARVVEAQIETAGGGLLMGGDSGDSGQSPGASGDPHPRFTAGFAVPGGGIEPSTRGFSILADATRTTGDDTDSRTRWEANGQLASLPRTAQEVTVPSREDGSDPPRPGLARVPRGADGVRLEVGGRVLARTDAEPGELVEDVEARLKLAAGQRGGLS